jgi:hypothetical protein
VKYINGEKVVRNDRLNIPQKNSSGTVIKKAIDMNYLENVFKNTLQDNPEISISSEDAKINLEFDLSYANTRELNNKIIKELLVISKGLSPITNQVQVIAYAPDAGTALDISDMVSRKLEEFGYEEKIMRTIPEGFFTENIEKNKNTVKIKIIINSYEAIF